MREIVLAIAVIVACASLNRLRGDEGWKPAWLPGRALIYVTPLLAAIALMVQPWPVAAAFAAGYAFWAVWGWGHILMRVGGRRPDRSPDKVERVLLLLPGSIAPVLARMLFALPGVVLVAWLTGYPEFWIAAPAFAATATVAYHILFRPLMPMDWLRAEVAVGALWGVLICVA